MGQKGKVLQEVEAKLQSLVDFYKMHHNPNLKFNLKAHQIVRLFEVLRNGHKRILCGDSTSAGKSLTATAIKAFLDRDLERKSRTLVFAPNQTVLTAWRDGDIRAYYDGMGFPQATVDTLKVRTVRKQRDIGSLDGDFVVINYDKFNKRDFEGNKYRRTILSNLHKFDSFIFDEAHNLANIFSSTSSSLKEIIGKTKDKHSLMLSATSLPNKISGAGFMLYLLDPDKFAHYASRKFVYCEDKYAIKDMILEGKWLTFSREDVKEIFGLPELNIHAPQDIEIDERFAREYHDRWAELSDLSRIADLRRIMNLGKAQKLNDIFDSAGSRAQGISKLEEALGVEGLDHKQLGVFTFLREGVQDKLHELLCKMYGSDKVAIINGSIPVEERVKLAESYGAGDLRSLLVTAQTMGEGIPLTTYDKPAITWLFEPPISPREYDQILGRNYRFGQTADVDVIETIAHSLLLEQLMLASKPELEAQFEVEFRGSWEATNTDFDRCGIRADKEEVNRRAQEAYGLDEMLKIVSEVDDSDGKAPESGLKGTPNAPKGSPNRKLMDGTMRVRDSTGKGSRHLMENPGLEKLVEGYSQSNKDFGETTPAEINRSLAERIKVYEDGEGKKFRKIIDMGCGTACLARAIKRNIYNLDLCEKMLNVGKERSLQMGLYKEMDLEEYFLKADMKNSGIEKSSMDVVAVSQSLQYMQQSYGKRDIEDILIESNRILKKGGYFVTALTGRTTTESEAKALSVVMEQYGFKVLEREFKSLPSSKNGYYVIIGRKENNNYDYVEMKDGPFVMYNPKKIIATGGIRRGDLEDRNNGRDKKKNGKEKK